MPKIDRFHFGTHNIQSLSSSVMSWPVNEKRTLIIHWARGGAETEIVIGAKSNDTSKRKLERFPLG